MKPAAWDETVLLAVAHRPGSTAVELGNVVAEHARRGAAQLGISVEGLLRDAAIQLRRAIVRLLDEGKIRTQRIPSKRTRGRPSFEITYYVADSSIEARPFPIGRPD